MLDLVSCWVMLKAFSNHEAQRSRATATQVSAPGSGKSCPFSEQLSAACRYELPFGQQASMYLLGALHVSLPTNRT